MSNASPTSILQLQGVIQEMGRDFTLAIDDVQRQIYAKLVQDAEADGEAKCGRGPAEIRYLKGRLLLNA